MISAVIDTNLIIASFINRRGVPSRVVDAIRHGAYVPLMTTDVLAEYRRVLAKPVLAEKYAVDLADVAGLFSLLEERGKDVVPVTNLRMRVRDIHDEHLLAAALGGAADYLVSGDNHLLILAGDSRLGKLRIVTAREFLTILEQQEGGI